MQGVLSMDVCENKDWRVSNSETITDISQTSLGHEKCPEMPSKPDEKASILSPSNQNSQIDRKVVYYPPSEQLINRFAREVCTQLAQNGNDVYIKPEVVSGFAQFLNVIAQITAKCLNEDHTDLLDSLNT
jgi:hypothetical protein